MIVQFLINGSIIDTITTSSSTWSTTTVLLGEGQGTVPSQPAATWWFDEVSFIHSGSEQLGNRGFESALAGSYLTPNVYSNWCNVHPSRGSDRYNDQSYTGDWSGGIKKPVGLGCWLHQDTPATELGHSSFKARVRRSSTTPFGAVRAQLIFNRDSAMDTLVGSVLMRQTNSNTITTTAMSTTHTGFAPIVDDTWNLWEIRIYPDDIIPTTPGGWSVGMIQW